MSGSSTPICSGRGPSHRPWELKAYAACDLAPQYDLIIGIDSDCVLCAGVGDVAYRALETGRFTGAGTATA